MLWFFLGISFQQNVFAISCDVSDDGNAVLPFVRSLRTLRREGELMKDEENYDSQGHIGNVYFWNNIAEVQKITATDQYTNRRLLPPPRPLSMLSGNEYLCIQGSAGPSEAIDPCDNTSRGRFTQKSERGGAHGDLPEIP